MNKIWKDSVEYITFKSGVEFPSIPGRSLIREGRKRFYLQDFVCYSECTLTRVPIQRPADVSLGFVPCNVVIYLYMNISSTFRLKVLIMIESKISEHFINDSDTVVDQCRWSRIARASCRGRC